MHEKSASYGRHTVCHTFTRIVYDFTSLCDITLKYTLLILFCSLYASFRSVCSSCEHFLFISETYATYEDSTTFTTAITHSASLTNPGPV